jgi:hypothetical protein
VQPLLHDVMVPADRGRQSVRLLKDWVGKPETRCATPLDRQAGLPDFRGLRYLNSAFSAIGGAAYAICLFC